MYQLSYQPLKTLNCLLKMAEQILGLPNVTKLNNQSYNKMNQTSSKDLKIFLDLSTSPMDGLDLLKIQDIRDECVQDLNLNTHSEATIYL
jgi:hypothetical protein